MFRDKTNKMTFEFYIGLSWCQTFKMWLFIVAELNFPQTAMHRRELLSSPGRLLEKARRMHFGCSLCMRVFSFICVNNDVVEETNVRKCTLSSSIFIEIMDIQHTVYSMVVISYEICSTVYVFSAQYRP